MRGTLSPAVGTGYGEIGNLCLALNICDWPTWRTSIAQRQLLCVQNQREQWVFILAENGSAASRAIAN